MRVPAERTRRRAEWIWNLAVAWFFAAVRVLDVYHALEHLATAGRQALGDGAALTRWLEAARRKLVGDGYAGVCEVLTLPLDDPEAAGRLAAAAGGALNYFAGHRHRLGYAVRLRCGQVIGSGLVEGTIKQRVNLRLKRTGARWQATRVGPFVELLALSDGPEWAEHWMAHRPECLNREAHPVFDMNLRNGIDVEKDFLVLRLVEDADISRFHCGLLALWSCRNI